jgi:hypothetical protein
VRAGHADVGGASWVRLHPLLETLFQSWEQAGICWCLLRVPAQPLAPTGDIDLLVERADVQRAIRVAEALGFARLAGWGYASDTFLLGHRPPDPDWLWLHVACELMFGPYQVLRTGAETSCLARRQQVGGIRLLAPKDAFWVSLLHCLLDKRKTPQHHRERLQELASTTRLDFNGGLSGALARLCPPGWHVERAVKAVKAGEWDELDQLAIAVASECARQHDPRATLAMRRRAARLVARARNLVHPAVWCRYASRQRQSHSVRLA